jgi:rfaE bifunctional protein kinase chain/domain
VSAQQELLDIIARFPRQTVLALADLVADEFVFGEIARVSREAPVLILKRRESQILPGGGANAVYNLAALGARVLPVGVVGADENGAALLRQFRARGISTRGILVSRDLLTTTKTRILAGTIHGSRQQVLRIDREPERAVPAPLRRRLESQALRLARRAHAILISDYGYGAAAPAMVARLRAVRGSPVTVDARYQIGRYTGATAATPNEPEVEAELGIRIGANTAVLEKAGRTLLRRLRTEALLITRGRDGMALFERGKPAAHIPIHGGDQNTDVTGAGDTVIAVFTLALAAGATFLQAARLANLAGGIVVMKRGTATASAEELRQAAAGS